MRTRILTTLLAVAVMASLLLAGCVVPEPAALSDDQVVQAVDGLLAAISSDDYQAFTRDLSDAMISAFTEAQFTSLHDLLQNASGNYVSCEQPELTNGQGYAVYRLKCEYDKEPVMVTVIYAVDGDKMEGLSFDSTNLRTAVR